MQVGRLFGRGNVAVYDFHRWGCVTERQKQCILQQKLSIDFPLTCGQLDARLNGIIQQVADDDHQINRSDLYSRKVIDLKTNINVVLFGHLRFLIQQRIDCRIVRIGDQNSISLAFLQRRYIILRVFDLPAAQIRGKRCQMRIKIMRQLSLGCVRSAQRFNTFRLRA